jgi:hypothetical protein
VELANAVQPIAIQEWGKGPVTVALAVAALRRSASSNNEQTHHGDCGSYPWAESAEERAVFADHLVTG